MTGASSLLLLCVSTMLTLLCTPAAAADASICPGSPASVHAKCDMTVTFPENDCDQVRTEILQRLQHTRQWKDPHNQGTYTVLNQEPNELQASRRTGDGRYVDLLGFSFTTDTNNNKNGCVVQACSESQVFSILDMSTNYCNLRNLYCNDQDDDVIGCPVIQYSFKTYTEEYKSCWQRKVSNCIVKGGAAEN